MGSGAAQMADDPKTGNFANNGALVFALLSAIVLAFNQYASLQVARPAAEDAKFAEPAFVQDVDARLWQDPFSAVAKAEVDRKSPLNCEKTENDPHCRTPIDQLEESNSLEGANRLLILAATVSGAPYPEDAEDRRRTRYAIVSGLDRMGFAPNDAQHIGFFYEGTGNESASSTLPITIPFELFSEKTRSGNPAKVLVLWLDEDKLRNFPLSKLSEILGLIPCPKDISCGSQIIGPKSSDTLRSMVEEATKKGSPSAWPNLVGLSFYAYGATVPDKIVLGGLNGDGPSSVRDFLNAPGQFDFRRIIATDDSLAASAVGELGRRGVKLSADQHVVLISESDTLYGRTSVGTFEQAFIDAAKQSGNDPVNAENLRNWILVRTYLHGLDGALPQSAKNEKKKDEETSKPAEGDADARATDRPYGQGQDDYLRRLADDLKAKDLEAGEKIKAIGIIGGDVYDKLRLLRALKPEFPEALFFTTDYDASLTMQSELRFTRNLIITTSFGPLLRPERQCDIPPFRDAYETSAFLATQVAMSSAGYEAPCPLPTGSHAQTAQVASKDRSDPSGQPGARRPTLNALGSAVTFEVARTGDLIALPSLETLHNWVDECSDSLSACRGDFLPDDTPLYPPVNPEVDIFGRKLPLSKGIAAPAAILSLIAGLVIVSRAIAEKSSRNLYLLYWPIALLVIASYFGIQIWPPFVNWITEDGKGEPIRLFLGVSVWPTMILRVVMLLLSVWLILISFVKMRRNLEDIRTEMQLAPPSPTGSIFNYIAYSLNVFRLYNLPARKNQAYPVNDAWQNYVKQSGLMPTIVRIIIWVTATFFLLLVLFSQFGQPLNPARGHAMRHVYFVLTSIDVFLMLFLVFLIADATLFLFLFVRQLSRGHSKWGWLTEQCYADKLGLDDSNLPFDKKVLNDWIDISFIAARTKCINSLIWYPFGVIALMIVSRSTVFANFPLSVPIIITQGVSFAIVFGCAFLLNGVAEDARDLAAKGLSDEIDKAKGRPRAQNGPLLEHMLGRVQTIQEGSFRPFLKQPVIGAILLPISSIGWTAVLEGGHLLGQ
jgi:hypothetical protein